jgi:hypothetical protein
MSQIKISIQAYEYVMETGNSHGMNPRPKVKVEKVLTTKPYSP